MKFFVAVYLMLLGAATAHMGISSPGPIDKAVGDNYRFPVWTSPQSRNGGGCHGRGGGTFAWVWTPKSSGTCEIYMNCFKNLPQKGNLKMSGGAAHNGGPCKLYKCTGAIGIPGCRRNSLPNSFPGCKEVASFNHCTARGHFPYDLGPAPTPAPKQCQGVVCKNRGRCAEGNGGKCTCSNGFTGNLCEVPPPPTCNDGRMNGDEDGLDCGGSKCDKCTKAEWIVGNFGACSKTCGGGKQTRPRECKRIGMKVPDLECKDLHNVETKRACNNEPCPLYSWYEKSSECSKPCGGGKIIRDQECLSSYGGVVSDTLCAAPKPAATETPCNTVDEVGACMDDVWETTPWSQCMPNCRQTRKVTCTGSNCTASKPVGAEACLGSECKTQGNWQTCNWEPCTAACSGNVGSMMNMQHRSVLCKDNNGDSTSPENCDSNLKPASYIDGCNPQPCRSHNWMADGPWSSCGVNGTRTNGFHCHTPGGMNAANSACEADVGPMPMTEESCDLTSCPEDQAGLECQFLVTDGVATISTTSTEWDTTAEELRDLNPALVGKADSHVPAAGLTVWIPGDCSPPGPELGGASSAQVGLVSLAALAVAVLAL